METFKKRQKEMKRLERQQEKAAKRKENKARAALGITSEAGSEIDGDQQAATSEPVTLSTID
jgi:hypothetical protein